MRYYRLYFLDDSGHFRGVVEMRCSDDAEALDCVGVHADGRAMELWERARPVKAFPAHQPAFA